MSRSAPRNSTGIERTLADPVARAIPASLALVAILWSVLAGLDAVAPTVLAMILISVVATRGALSWRPGHRFVAGLIAMGVVLNALGVVLGRLDVTGVVLATVGQVSWAFGPIFIAAALVTLGIRTRALASVGDVLDTAAIAVVVMLIFYKASIAEVVEQTIATHAHLATLWSFLFAGSVVIAMLLRLLAHPCGRRFLSPLLVASVVTFTITDFAEFVLPQDPQWAAVCGAMHLLSYLLLALSVAGSATPSSTEADACAQVFPRLGWWGFVTVIPPLIVPPVLLLLDRFQGQPVGMWQPLAGLYLLLSIAYVRIGWTLRELYRARQEGVVARDAALDAARVKSVFLATMSHEIRTPMHGVIGLADLLRDTELDERQRQYTEGITTAGRSLLELINDVLDFSRGEAGLLELEDVEFVLPSVISDVTELLSIAADGRGLMLRSEVSPELWETVSGDPTRIRQILVNLVGNAVKFTEHGEVVVRATLTRREGPTACVRLEVIDTGVGIAETAQQLVFERFHQADASTARRSGGSGLGLAIARQLVTSMGGTISLASAPGQGSTFTVDLPLTVVDNPEEPPVSPTLAGHRVLVADRREDSRLRLSGRLRSWGMETDTVTTSDELLDRLSANSYSVVLTESTLLGLASPVVQQRLRAQAVPVLVLDSEDGAELVESAASQHDLIGTPVHLDQLGQALTAILSPADGRPSPTLTVPAQGSSRAGRILLVEDDQLSQIVTGAMIKNLGYDVVVASDGPAALDRLAGGGFDAVVMDCYLPVTDGYVTTELWRSQVSSGSRLPIIAMTASILPADRHRSIEAGMDDFLTKPVNVRQLADVLRRWVPTVRERS